MKGKPPVPGADRARRPLIPLRRALTDHRLLGSIMGPDPVTGVDTRLAMRTLLLASQGEELTVEEHALYERLTGRIASPGEPIREAHFIAGRRSGKSYSIAALAVYLSALCDWSSCLSAGERGQLLILAGTVEQAKVLLGYVVGAFQASPALSKLIASQTKTTLLLTNGIQIDVRPADYRRVRGWTLIACLCDEIAFWRDENSANPATEIVRAIRPALSTTRGQLFTISSPYARAGFQYEQWRRHHGPDGDVHVLVAKGPTVLFNPTIPQSDIDRAMAEDPEAARSEWLGEFRDDIAAFLSADAWDVCVIPDRRELPRASTVKYTAFVDPSGGRGDSMTLSIAHMSEKIVIVDLLREWRPPFNPDSVVAEVAEILKAYGLRKVTGDNYAAEWVISAFQKVNVAYAKCEYVRSELYLDFLPLINSRRVEVLDHQRLRTQAISLERRTSKVGRDTVNHPTGGHDDLINSVAGAVVLAHVSGRNWNWDNVKLLNDRMAASRLMRRRNGR